MAELPEDVEFGELSEEEQRMYSEAVFTEAVDAMAEVLQEHEAPIGFAVIGALPPDHNSLRFGSNLNDDSMHGMIISTAQALVRQGQQGNGQGDSGLITPS